MEAIKVFLSGASKSGKTVYLAALNDLLSTPEEIIGLRCQTTQAARNVLGPIHDRLGSGWPPPTQLFEEHELPFDFFVKPKGGKSQLASKVTFLDYSGEALMPTHDDEYTEIRRKEIGEIVESCDVIICVLDGQLVWDSIKNHDGSATPELQENIRITHEFWNSTNLEENLKHNYYFLVTKWDIFDDTDEEVAQIRSMLQNIGRIRKHIRSVDDDSEIKIIPVSAVGKGFAKWKQDENGRGKMEIVASQPSDPINALMPIAMLVPGLMRAEIRRVERESRAEGQRILDETVPWWKRLLSNTAVILDQSETLRRIVKEIGVDPTDIDRLAAKMKDPLVQTHADRERRIGELAAQVRNEKDAAAVAQTHFDNLCVAFNERYPSATIRG